MAKVNRSPRQYEKGHKNLKAFTSHKKKIQASGGIIDQTYESGGKHYIKYHYLR